jgi:hypothetical protein
MSCIVHAADDLRNDDGRQEADDDHDHHDLDQREPAGAPDACRRPSVNLSGNDLHHDVTSAPRSGES